MLLEHRVTKPTDLYRHPGNTLLDLRFGARLRQCPAGKGFDAAMEAVADEIRTSGGSPALFACAGQPNI